MIPIEILAITFATLGALIAAGCVTIALYARYKGRKPVPGAGVSFMPYSKYAEVFWRSVGPFTDLSQADHIEITIAEHSDGSVRLWVNVDGANAFRAYNVKNLIIDDRRDWSMEAALKTR